jgi:hypothetical protein
MFKIVKRADKHAIYASGFWSLQRAEKWLSAYDPTMWMEKTVTKDDLEIVPETRFQKRTKVNSNG